MKTIKPNQKSVYISTPEGKKRVNIENNINYLQAEKGEEVKITYQGNGFYSFETFIVG